MANLMEPREHKPAQQEEFTTSLVGKTQGLSLQRQVMALVEKTSTLDKEADKLAKNSKLSQAEARMMLQELCGYPADEFFRRLGNKMDYVVDKMTDRVANNIEEIPIKELPKALVALTNLSLTLKGRPSSISQKQELRIGGKDVAQIRAEMMEYAREEYEKKHPEPIVVQGIDKDD